MIDAAESAKPSAFSFSQDEIDHFLLLGSNNRDSRMEIATEYSKQKSLRELAAFLHMSYRGGYGLKENGRTIAAWYCARQGVEKKKKKTALPINR